MKPRFHCRHGNIERARDLFHGTLPHHPKPNRLTQILIEALHRPQHANAALVLIEDLLWIQRDIFNLERRRLLLIVA